MFEKKAQGIKKSHKEGGGGGKRNTVAHKSIKESNLGL